MTIHNKRVQELRELMKENHIDYYMITTQDYHNSEYVHEYFKEREYISGFTGSNGTLLVSMSEAGLWTDGRYYLQAEEELKDSGISLYKMGEKDVLSIAEYLKEHVVKGECVGFCGKCVTATYGETLEKICEDKGAHICADVDLPRAMWKGAPTLPCHPIWILEEQYSGKSVSEKIESLRKWMKDRAQYYFLSKLDDIMWLFNLRGNDVACNPVALSYAMIGEKETFLFVQKKAVSQALEQYLERENIRMIDYADMEKWIGTYAFSDNDTVLINKNNISFSCFRLLQKRVTVIDAENKIEEEKSAKNELELQNVREVYLQDSAAVCRFLYWLKHNIGKEEITEISAAEKLETFRREIPGFLDISFPTICGYKENGAIVHYEATEETNKALHPEGMVLVDSGGQYLQGTTDITRTIVLGEISEEEKELFCAVASGTLKLADAVFLEGCTGRNLDILARETLWKKGLDYKHGTGHGIGYVLNVHEGPQNIRWKYTDMREAPLKAGMLVSDEPGIYISGKFGVRIENILQVEKAEENEYGTFLKFQMLTYVPIDIEALDPKYLSVEDLLRINEYHEKVYEKIVPYLTIEKEREWLRMVTRPIDFL